MEKAIENTIKKYLKTLPDCWFFKMHGGMYSTAGVPDLIICLRGRFIALEVKTEKGKLTMLQKSTLEKINAAGGTAHKVTSLSEVKEILENIGREI